MITLKANFRSDDNLPSSLDAVVATFDTIQAAIVVLAAIADHCQDYGQLTLVIDSSTDSPRPDDRYVTVAAKPFPAE